MLFGDRRFYDWRGTINLASRRDTQRAIKGVGHEEGTEDMLAVELGSDETSPESELPAGPAWDEQQAKPMASADAVAPSPWTHDNAQLALLVDPDARSRPVSDEASGDERRLGPRSFGVTLSYLAPVRTLNIGKWSTSVGRFHWMRGPCSRHSAIGKSKDFLRLFYPPRRRSKPSEIISSGKQRGKSDDIKTG